MIIKNKGFYLSVHYRVFSHALYQAMKSMDSVWLESSYNEKLNCFDFYLILSENDLEPLMTEKGTKNNIRINLSLIKSDEDMEKAINEIRNLWNLYIKKQISLDQLINEDRLKIIASNSFARQFNKNADVINFLLETKLIAYFQPSINIIEYEAEDNETLITSNDDETPIFSVEQLEQSLNTSKVYRNI